MMMEAMIVMIIITTTKTENNSKCREDMQGMQRKKTNNNDTKKSVRLIRLSPSCLYQERQQLPPPKETKGRSHSLFHAKIEYTIRPTSLAFLPP